jgi:peptidoglycan/xylan/chitin deacetylase (PgdA/CDA1 family)
MKSLPIRSLFSVLSPGGHRGRLSVLLFHRVLNHPDPVFPGEVDLKRFDQICSSLKSWCNVLPLAEAVDKLRSASLPPRAACITFDDGYADNFKCALPVLEKHGLHATFFVATGFLDGGRMWNDTLIESIRTTKYAAIDLSDLGIGFLETRSVGEKREALAQLIPVIKHLEPDARDDAVAALVTRCEATELPNDLMMTSDELCALRAAGMDIGAHTVNHPILASCDQATARNEISEGRSTLEDLLNERISLFAYPNGKLGTDYTPEHVNIVRELGFDAAVSTNPGASFHGSDVHQLSRFTPWDREAWRFGLRLARNTMKKPVA